MNENRFNYHKGQAEKSVHEEVMREAHYQQGEKKKKVKKTLLTRDENRVN